MVTNPNPLSFSPCLTEQGFLYFSLRQDDPACGSELTLCLNKSRELIFLVRSWLQHGDIHNLYFVMVPESCEMNPAAGLLGKVPSPVQQTTDKGATFLVGHWEWQSRKRKKTYKLRYHEATKLTALFLEWLYEVIIFSILKAIWSLFILVDSKSSWLIGWDWQDRGKRILTCAGY